MRALLVGGGVSGSGHSDQRRRNLSRMSLPELLRHVRDDLGISARRMAMDVGYDGLRTTINNLIDGSHSGEVKRETLARIATVLEKYGIEEKVTYAAALKAPPPVPFRLPPEADYLTQRQRTAVLGVVTAMLEDRPNVRSDARRLRAVDDEMSDPAARVRPAARSGRRETQDPEQT